MPNPTSSQTSSPTSYWQPISDAVNRYCATTTAIDRTCAQLSTLARRYAAIQTRRLSEDMTDAVRDLVQHRAQSLEAQLADVAADLPQPKTPDGDRGRWRVAFESDPHGYTVRLIAPDGRQIGLDR